MPDRYHVLPIALIALLLPRVMVAGVTGSEKRAPADRVLDAIQNCMTQSPAPWPDEWKREYIDTIRSVVHLHRDAPHYAERLVILRKGFGPYWESFDKSGERSLFDVHRTRIRWYVEHLMGTKFPTEEERQKLRDQYTEIWDHAASSLLAQFPPLDPNIVQAAKADDLRECYRKIDLPLLPIYLRPISETQMAQIKQRWHDLRYARVDLWRSLGGGSTTPSGKRDAPTSNAARDYQLTKQSLSQLLAQIWMVVAKSPDYYRSALENQTNAVRRLLQSKREARSDQHHLQEERSRQLLQTEHIAFLLTALLETAQRLDGSATFGARGEIPSEQQGRSLNGEEVVPMR